MLSFSWGAASTFVLLTAGLEISDWQLWAVVIGGPIYAVFYSEES